jgi:hypothetical protein
MEIEKIKEGMQKHFFNILNHQEVEAKVNIIGLLLRCLASIVHHTPSLIETASKHPGHLFTQIPILKISQLKKLITTKPFT